MYFLRLQANQIFLIPCVLCRVVNFRAVYRISPLVRSLFL